jgi:hypothetical protein
VVRVDLYDHACTTLVLQHCTTVVILLSPQGNVIHDVSAAIAWLKSTFFFVRVKRSPATYGLPARATPAQLEANLNERVVAALRQLAAIRVVTMDEVCSRLNL